MHDAHAAAQATMKRISLVLSPRAKITTEEEETERLKCARFGFELHFQLPTLTWTGAGGNCLNNEVKIEIFGEAASSDDQSVHARCGKIKLSGPRRFIMGDGANRRCKVRFVPVQIGSRLDSGPATASSLV
jgi:hypothetical protein